MRVPTTWAAASPLYSHNSLRTLKLLSPVCLSCAQISETQVLREEVIKPLDVGITEAARRWGMSRVALSRVLNERAGISAEMAVRLGRALD